MVTGYLLLVTSSTHAAINLVTGINRFKVFKVQLLFILPIYYIKLISEFMFFSQRVVVGCVSRVAQKSSPTSKKR